MKSLKEIIDKRINTVLEKIPKTINGTAISTENSSGFVFVSIGNNQNVYVQNKSAEYISVGDAVIIQYNKNISSGCIIRRTGAFRSNGELNITQAEFDNLEANGELIDGWTYYIIG